jgi:hypothetical protein
MKLTSTAFGHNESIPRKFTCQGEDLSPALRVAEIPDGTQSLALIMDDPDAPGRTFDHWIAYDIPADTAVIEEGATPGTQGKNDFGKAGYGGPCPPSGTHRYFFRMYALDDRLDLPAGIGKQDLERTMEGHILDQAELVGRYAKE